MIRLTLLLILSLSTAAPAETIEAEVQRVDEVVAMYLNAAMKFAQEIDSITGETNAVPALAASQSAWTAYRDAQCAFLGATFGGEPGTEMAVGACKIDLGEDRARELAEFVR
ncbi:MAG: lysozyme inhibitor LprI family protein [Roseovarius sp.]